MLSLHTKVSTLEVSNFQAYFHRYEKTVLSMQKIFDTSKELGIQFGLDKIIKFISDKKYRPVSLALKHFIGTYN